MMEERCSAAYAAAENAELNGDGTANGVWMTLPQLARLAPADLWRVEGEPAPPPLFGVPQNLHVLARLWVEVPAGGGVLRLSADDYCHAWLNGRWLGQGPAPGRPGMAWYQEYPLSAGRQLLAVHLYYQGLLNRVWQSGDGRCGVWAQLCPAGAGEGPAADVPAALPETGPLPPADMPAALPETGPLPPAAGAAAAAFAAGPAPKKQAARPIDLTTGWRYHLCTAYSGSPTGYDTQFTENFDSRLWPEGWQQPGYDDAAWPLLCPAGWGRQMHRQPTAPLERSGVGPAARRMVPGGLQLDFGRERAGTLHAVMRGHAGQRLTLRYGEELDAAGRVPVPMRCGCVYEDSWTLAEGESVLHAFDYKAFRYLEILGGPGFGGTGADAAPTPPGFPALFGGLPAPEPPALSECWVWERHYPLPEDACVLHCPSDELEDIFAICKNAVRCGSQESYLDCPTREKGQYLGDAVITARAQVWLTGKTDLLRKCIGDFAATAAITPGLLAVAPGALRQEAADFSLLFAALPLTDYAFTGDKAFLRRCWPVVCGVIDCFSRYLRPDGLLENVTHAWNLVDWPETARDGYDFPLTRPAVGRGCHNVVNALWVGALKMREEIARILDIPLEGMDSSAGACDVPAGCSGPHRPDAIPADTAGAKTTLPADASGTKTTLPSSQTAAAAFQKAFYRPEQHLFADSETSSHCSIHANAFASCFGLTAPQNADAYEALLFTPGRYCGPWAACFALRGLARLGRYDAAYRFITRTDAHGWRNMLREGATACFEAFGKAQKWNTSLCHPWASGALPVLIEELAGLHPDPAAPEGFRFVPKLPKALGGFRLTLPFRGRRLQIEKEADAPARLTVSVP